MGRLFTIAWLAAMERAAMERAAMERAASVLVRLAQLGWGKHTSRAAHVAVTANRTPALSLARGLGLRCRPRYRSCAA
jgi:hypothetical protein